MKQLLHTSAGRHDFATVMVARTLGMLGDILLLTVIALQIATGDQPWRLTVVFIAFAVPLFALAPVAGRIVDEFDSRQVLLLAGLVQAVAAAWIAISGTFPMLVAAVVMLQAGQAVSGPAWSALLPKIVGTKAVGRATGNLSAAGAVAGMAGAALGGVIYEPLGFRGAVLINAAGFVAIAIAGVLVRTRRGRRYQEGESGRLRAEAVAGAPGPLAADVTVTAVGDPAQPPVATDEAATGRAGSTVRSDVFGGLDETAVARSDESGGPIATTRVRSDEFCGPDKTTRARSDEFGRPHETAVAPDSQIAAPKAPGRRGRSETGGWAFCRRDTVLAVLLPALWALVVAGEALNVAEVFLIRGVLGASPTLYGICGAAFLVGSIVGPLLAGRVSDDRRRIWWCAVTAASCGVLVIGMSISPSAWIVAGLLAVSGVLMGAFNAMIVAVILVRPPDAMRGRVMATVNGTMRGFAIIALALGGLLVQFAGARIAFAVIGVLLAASAALIRRVVNAVPGPESVAAPEPGLVVAHEG